MRSEANGAERGRAGWAARSPERTGTGTGTETPAWQTNFPTVRFFTLTRTEFVPAGRLLGSWPES